MHLGYSPMFPVTPSHRNRQQGLPWLQTRLVHMAADAHAMLRPWIALPGTGKPCPLGQPMLTNVLANAK